MKKALILLSLIVLWFSGWWIYDKQFGTEYYDLLLPDLNRFVPVGSHALIGQERPAFRFKFTKRWGDVRTISIVDSKGTALRADEIPDRDARRFRVNAPVLKLDYDDKGRIATLRFYDDEESPTLGRYGVHRIDVTYDEVPPGTKPHSFGNNPSAQILQAYMKGKSSSTDDEPPRGRIREIFFYDIEDKPVQSGLFSGIERFLSQ